MPRAGRTERATHEGPGVARTAATRSGLTLLELIVVIGILAVLAALLLPRGDTLASHGQQETTLASMTVARDALVGDRAGPGFLTDLGELPLTLAGLFRQSLAELPSGAPVPFYDPQSGRGWNGPYLLRPTGAYARDEANGFGSAYGAPGDPCLFDGWRRAVVLQRPTDPGASDAERQAYARLVSAGPNGRIDTPLEALDPGERGDDLVVFLFRASPPPDSD